MSDPYKLVGQQLAGFQRELAARGVTLRRYIEDSYLSKWRSESLYHASRVRTALISGFTDFLIERGLVNLDRVSLSLLTDPLAHAVEGLPQIPYGGATYVTMHSMIYAKCLACHNPYMKGIFVDGSNLRLEPRDPAGKQRGKYLIDFSQYDVELRRDREVDLDTYLDKPAEVTDMLQEDLNAALRFFEGLTRAGLERVVKLAGDSLEAMGKRIDLSDKPFPIFYRTEAEAAFGKDDLDAKMGERCDAQAFFVVGLLRENYDLIYPYLRRDGTRRPLREFTSREIFNYDICLKGRRQDDTWTPAREILSGGLREWLPETCVARLLDNHVIPEAPVLHDGEIQNIEALGGYGPFLTLALARDAAGRPQFPATFGGGFGVERILWTLLQGPHIKTIDDVTFFGKNPDSAPLFLF